MRPLDGAAISPPPPQSPLPAAHVPCFVSPPPPQLKVLMETWPSAAPLDKARRRLRRTHISHLVVLFGLFIMALLRGGGSVHLYLNRCQAVSGFTEIARKHTLECLCLSAHIFPFLSFCLSVSHRLTRFSNSLPVAPSHPSPLPPTPLTCLSGKPENKQRQLAKT